MDRSKSPARLPAPDTVFLIQTDTTVGFASQDAHKLAAIKKRAPDKPFLKTFASLKHYKQNGRVPTSFKNEIRRAKRTTFVVKNQAFRIVRSGHYHTLLKRFGWLFSTSANRSGQTFEHTFAVLHADVVVEDARGLFEATASTILKIRRNRKRKIRSS